MEPSSTYSKEPGTGRSRQRVGGKGLVLRMAPNYFRFLKKNSRVRYSSWGRSAKRKASNRAQLERTLGISHLICNCKFPLVSSGAVGHSERLEDRKVSSHWMGNKMDL